jgi:putative oxygen-independent coproporphyrinogen III oxidase
MGLYFHLPYCRQRCPYCDFNIWVEPASGGQWTRLQEAMLFELELRAPLFAQHQVQTIYFGGGTPSLVAPEILASYLERLYALFDVAPHPEITIEVDPNTASPSTMQAWLDMGIHRLSFGWQSTHNSLLHVLGRGHCAEQSKQDYELARQVGFKNISIDLIAAVPGQTLQNLKSDLDAIIDLKPEHISVYQLTYAPHTAFDKARRKGKLQPIHEDEEASMLDLISTHLVGAQFEHYEVSNFARPGYRSLHNSNTWAGNCYLGVGPGAHSFFRQGWQQGWRWESTRLASPYFDAMTPPHLVQAKPPNPPLDDDKGVEKAEALNKDELLLERIMCGLRTEKGVHRSLLDMYAEGKGTQEILIKRIERARDMGWLRLHKQQCQPTSLGFRFADALADTLTPD